MAKQSKVSRKVLKKKFRVIFFLVTAILLFPYCPGFAQIVLFQDDFEDGNADGWDLEPGWQVEAEGGNYVLSGSGHSFARTGDESWRNYSFKARVKLMDDQSGTHLNYRDMCERYFIGFDLGQIYLWKTAPCGTHTELVSVDESHDVNRWYTVKIVGDQANIKVYVDDVLKIDYTGSDPVLAGAISFETHPDTHVHFDDVIVTALLSDTQWVATDGPLGGLGYDIRIHPAAKNIMYVTDNWAGVARSDNAGKTWYQSNSGISIKGGATGDAVNIFSLTVDPNDPDIVWAGTFGEGSAFGVFKSTDGATTWTLKTNGIALGDDIGLVFRGFTIQEGDSNIVYAQAEVPTTVNGWEFNRVKGRVYKTEDGGESWSQIWQGDNLTRYIVIHPDNSEILYLSTGIFDREAYNSDCLNDAPGGVGILKSIDGGENWTPMNNGLTDLYVGSLRMHPTNPQILFAATGNNACSGGYTGEIVSGLFRTTDGGASWAKVIAADVLTTVNFSPSNPDIVYAGSAGAFYRSDNRGLTWRKFTNTTGYNYGPNGIRAGVPIDVVVDPDNPQLLYANNYGGGVFRSADGAVTWEDWSKGYTGAEMSDLDLPSDNVSTLFAIGRSGPYKSFNYGIDWIGIANGDATNAEWYSVAVQPGNAEVVLIADEHQGVIFSSTNGGNYFAEVLRHPDTDASDPNKRQGFKTIAFSLSNPNVVYAALAKDRLTFLESSPVGTVIYKSTDSGETFSSLVSIIDGHNVNELVVAAEDSNRIYAATSNGVYKSTDGALNWTHLSTLGNRHIEALVIDPAQPDHLIAGELFGGIWISQDDGESWTGPHTDGFNSSNPYISTLAADPLNAGIVFAGDLYSGTYRSLDSGYTWSPFPDIQMTGLAIRAVKDMDINATAIFVATQGGGVFRYWLADLLPDPLSGDFDSINLGSSANQNFTVTNTGDVDLLLGSLSITGPDAFEFSIQNDRCSGQTLSPNSSCTSGVLFSPTSAVEKRANLEIPSNDPNNATIQVPLLGTVVEPCECDFEPAEPDRDVDGADLAAYIADNAGISLADFAGEYGRINCP